MTQKHINQELIDVFVHELKTPLTTQKLFADLIKTSRDYDKIASYAETIDQKANQQTKIINYVRDLAKIDAGIYPVETIVLPIASLNKFLKQNFSTDSAQKLASSSKQVRVSESILLEMLEIITDRFNYYQPHIKTHHLATFVTPTDFQLILSTNPLKHPIDSRRFDDKPVNQVFVNPNTALYFLQALLQLSKVHWYILNTKDVSVYALSFSIV